MYEPDGLNSVRTKLDSNFEYTDVDKKALRFLYGACVTGGMLKKELFKCVGASYNQIN